MLVSSLDWEDPLEKGQHTLVLLPGESHGQRSLVGYNRVAKSRTRLKQLSMHACVSYFILLEVDFISKRFNMY